MLVSRPPAASTRPRIGSLCTGYGGLDLAVTAVFGGSLAWVADPDPDAARICAHHWPDTPNLGDIREVDWETIEPVDITIGGYPCQPFSDAGQKRGTEDERHLWPYIARALRILRPAIAIFENVPGHLRRGFDTVLSDLAGLGFDAQWAVVPASQIGAPHHRKRLYVLATVADAANLGHERDRYPWRRRRRPTDDDRPAADAGHGDVPERARPARRPARQRAPERRLSRSDGTRSPTDAEPGWGPYEPAVRRWETVLGRHAPRPVEPSRTGDRLSPAFVEWMMGLPDGWVTAVPGLSRNARLRALGNGVVPQAGALAIGELWQRARTRVPA